MLIFKFNVYKSRDLKTLNFLYLKSDIIHIRQIEENDIRKQKVFQKIGEPNKSILSLNNVFDLKKKVLLTLNVFKKPFGWVV